MKQAAMYVRVSSQQQKENATIESQITVLTQLAKDNGCEIPPMWTFKDDGFSGTFLNRPALEKMRDYISEGLFEKVFILAPDRLARSYAHQAILMEEFTKQGVNVVFLNAPSQDTPHDKLLVQIQGMFAEYERAQIMERSRRGKKHKAKNGSVSVLGTAPYGYRYISSTIASDACFEIVNREASVVKIIFDLYTKERLPISKIRDYLYENNILSPKGNKKWDTTSISNILRKSTYRGIAYYGMREKCEPNTDRLPSRKLRSKDIFKSQRSTHLRPKSEWIGIEVPAIIENEVYEIAQDLLEKNKRLSKRNTKKGSLLQGLLVCKECGYSFTRSCSGRSEEGYSYYRCRNRKKKCGNRGIRVDDIDSEIWKSVTSLLENPELIRDEVLRRASELKNKPRQIKLGRFNTQLEKLEREANRLLDAYREECISLDNLKKEMSAIKCEKNRIKCQIKELDGNMSSKDLFDLEESVKYFSHRLQQGEEKLSIEEKRKILRMLIRDVEIGLDEIIVNHIIPITKNKRSDEIAHLCRSRVRDLRGNISRGLNGYIDKGYRRVYTALQIQNFISVPLQNLLKQC